MYLLNYSYFHIFSLKFPSTTFSFALELAFPNSSVTHVYTIARFPPQKVAHTRAAQGLLVFSCGRLISKSLCIEKPALHVLSFERWSLLSRLWQLRALHLEDWKYVKARKWETAGLGGGPMSSLLSLWCDCSSVKATS